MTVFTPLRRPLNLSCVVELRRKLSVPPESADIGSSTSASPFCGS